jgi:hypothetical protein
MLRLIPILALSLLLAACGSIARDERVLASGEPAVSDEMDCMAECLQDSAEDCESCADSCLRHPTSPAVASGPDQPSDE